MFTGIVETVAEVIEAGELSLGVRSNLFGLQAGESVAVNGVCLTVTRPAGGSFFADLSEETLKRTSLGRLRSGSKVNLERAMPAGGRFGGHLVQGHVDGVAEVAAVQELKGWVRMDFVLPGPLERYLVEKGSVTLEGVSLTVADLSRGSFTVALIPHTLKSTTMGQMRPGDPVNVEVDVLAKYVERLLGYASGERLGR